MVWCSNLTEASDVDNRFKSMPSHLSLRHFYKGITCLQQTTAKEHKSIEKVYIGVMAGLVPEDILPAIVAIIDFIYYAQLPSHTTSTLRQLDNALERFHNTKDVFIRRGCRHHFNINKIHSMMHYLAAICALGSADSYNTESPERLHIEYAKRAYKATNRIHFFHQMTEYLERRERVFKFDAYLRWAMPEHADLQPELPKCALILFTLYDSSNSDLGSLVGISPNEAHLSLFDREIFLHFLGSSFLSMRLRNSLRSTSRNLGLRLLGPTY